MPASVLPALRPLLRSPVLQVRTLTIYTIGKLTFPSEAESLREVLPAYLDNDPLCLVLLLGELEWLSDDDLGVQPELDRVIAHPSYLTRWTVLAHLDHWVPISGPPLDSKTRWLRTLSTDPVPLVAAEARHQLATLELELAGSAADWQPAASWQQKRRSLTQSTPPLTFSILENQFMNDLARRKQADYTLEDLAAFIDTLKPSLEP
jgi:hypothetical protein